MGAGTGGLLQSHLEETFTCSTTTGPDMLFPNDPAGARLQTAGALWRGSRFRHREGGCRSPHACGVGRSRGKSLCFLLGTRHLVGTVPGLQERRRSRQASAVGPQLQPLFRHCWGLSHARGVSLSLSRSPVALGRSHVPLTGAEAREGGWEGGQGAFLHLSWLQAQPAGKFPRQEARPVSLGRPGRRGRSPPGKGGSIRPAFGPIAQLWLQLQKTVWPQRGTSAIR